MNKIGSKIVIDYIDKIGNCNAILIKITAIKGSDYIGKCISKDFKLSNNVICWFDDSQGIYLGKEYDE